MEIIKFIIIGLVFGVLVKELADIKKHLFSIEARLRDKVDKPSDWDKWKEERAKKPLLTKEELDKEMTTEEKAYWRSVNGTDYPTSFKK
jgi:hypothetical protein